MLNKSSSVVLLADSVAPVCSSLVLVTVTITSLTKTSCELEALDEVFDFFCVYVSHLSCLGKALLCCHLMIYHPLA